MVKRKWTNREINAALQRIGACYELPPERATALEARIRREVTSRYGNFAIPKQPVVHAPEPARGGMLILLHALRSVGGVGRPALALAVLGVLVVGAIAVMRTLGGALPAATPNVTPSFPPSAVVASAAPVTPGSGVAVSVFTVEVRSQKSEVRSDAPAVRRVRRAGRPINPAAGVFDQWGESVFSEEGLLQNEREGKNIFTG